MKKNLWVIFAVVLLGLGAVQGTGKLQASDRFGDLAPDPELWQPITDVVDLTAKPSLEFKWSPFIGKLWERNYWDFRLYKGRDTVVGNQILVKKVDPNVYSMTLETGLFEDGQVYTWTLRQVYVDKKSDAAYSSFKVVKK